MSSEGQYYFDEDELIQDQMMEEEAEDEEIVYEEPEENDDGKEFDHDISNQGRDNTMQTNVVEEELRQQVVANSNMEDEENADLPVNKVTFLQKNKSSDLYSFERYNGIWRDNSSKKKNHSVSSTSIEGKNAREEFLRMTKDVSGTGRKSEGGVEGSTKNIVPSCTDDASLLACFKLRGESRRTTCTSTNSIRKRQLPARFVYDDYLLLARQRQITTPDGLDDYPSTPVALFNGKRIYLRCLSSQKHQNDHQCPSSQAQLLSHPFSKVIQGANRLQHLWVTAQQQRIKRNPAVNATLPPTHTSNDSNPVHDTSTTISTSCTKNMNTSSIRHYGEQLWVDKYAPKSFVDLLSEEKTNRNFLRALKEWDPYVFGRSSTTAPITTTAASLKDDVRPPITSRVFLLCGNAGVGKTTLAHT
jgi:hypothetical protein